MPSTALAGWRTSATTALDEVEAAHAAIGGTGRGRRYATGQVNNAYVVLLSSQFQRFCRDLHTEAAYHLAGLAPVSIRLMLSTRLTEGRKLDTGNPNPGNIGSDYGRLGFDFWKEPEWASSANAGRRRRLEQLNLWRNAVAHQDFSNPACHGRAFVTLADVRLWRGACDGLAPVFDAVVARHLNRLSGSAPW